MPINSCTEPAHCSVSSFLIHPQTIAVMSRKSSKRRNNGVNFRLEETHLLELKQRAARLGISSHRMGRQYVEDMLNSQYDRTQMIDAIKMLGDNIINLRRNVALSVEALLLAAGRQTDEEIEEWVKEQFKIP